MAAEFGATGIIVLFPIKLLQPSPSQLKQWLGFVHFAVSDKQPRVIDFAENRNETIEIQRVQRIYRKMNAFSGAHTGFVDVAFVVRCV